MAEPHDLRRSLGWFDTYALAVGSVIGAGIFTLHDEAAAAMGPAATLAWLAGGVMAAVLMLCYAEAGSREDRTGGPMLYAEQAFGQPVGFGVGWGILISRQASWAVLAQMFVEQVQPLLGESAPAAWLQFAAIFLTLGAVNLLGVTPGGRLHTVLVVIKLLPLVAFALLGVWHIDPERFTPFAPEGYAPLGETSVTLVYAYLGFEGMSIPAGEMRNPQRDVPRSLLAGVATVLVLYLATWAVCVGVLDDVAGSATPVADAARTFLGDAGATVIQFGVICSLFGILAFMALVVPRSLYAMASDGMLPRWIGGVWRNGAPGWAILLTTGLSWGMASGFELQDMLVFSVACRTAANAVACGAVIRLRRVAGPAPFRTPGGALIPVLAVSLCLLLLALTPQERLLGSAAAIATGFAIYGGYRLYRSR